MRRTTTARRGLAAAALTLSLGLALTACAGGSGDDPTPSATSTTTANPADAAALAKVEVEGDFESKPTITLPEKPFEVTALTVRVVDEGDGATIEEGQTVFIETTAVNGADGSELGSTVGGESGPEKVVADDQLPPELHDALVGQKVGTRILFALPAQAGTNVVVGDVVKAEDTPEKPKPLAGPEGEAVTPPAGLPTVTLDADGKPSITPIADPAPTSLVVQPLIKGTGAEVTADQTLTVNYTGWLWDGTEFDSSWTRGEPAEFGLNGVIPGWTQGLTGQTVGSQVLLVIPPELGYGEQGSGETIPPNSTLIFVVDILSAY